MKYKYHFTLQAGRTGTAWLADFLRSNLDIPAIHEPLGIDDFGIRMPDIKIMRTFNDRGNAPIVKAFYQRKFDEISAAQAYAETNHTLGKCGLIENISQHGINENACVIVLRRGTVQQCLSHLARGDFVNITVDWQWYLSQNYKNVIVDPRVFAALGHAGRALWYVYEMEARIEYYACLYSGDVNFVHANLNDIVTQEGARRFLEHLGVGKAPDLPKQTNASRLQLNQGLVDSVQAVNARVDFNCKDVARSYIDSGRRLGEVR